MLSSVGPAKERPYLEIAEVSKGFDGNRVLAAFSLSVSRGEFVTLLGPSGCGKTTLLRLIAGLLRVESGEIRLDGRDITHLPPHRRNIGIVFQTYALFPHLDVRDNVGFGLKARGMNRADIDREVQQALDMVQLGSFGARSVRALSGGQQQRVSLARVIATKPAVMLLDEPFSALDRKLRETMQVETRQLLRNIGATAIFVTHDQEEALIMSDRVVVMNQGRAEQIAPPATIYSKPSTPFVLEFVGQALRLAGKVESVTDGVVSIDTALGKLRAFGAIEPGESVLVAVRPELVRLEAGRNQDNCATASVRDVVLLGSRTQVMFDSAPGDVLMAEVSGVDSAHLRTGVSVPVCWGVADTLVYRKTAR